MPLGHGPEPEPELVALCRRRRRKLVARSMCAQKRFVTAYEARVWMSVWVHRVYRVRKLFAAFGFGSTRFLFGFPFPPHYAQIKI